MSEKTSDHSDKRQDFRYPHRGYATLRTKAGDAQEWDAHLINVSQRGALVAILDENDLQSGTEIEMSIEQESGNIHLTGKVAHKKRHYVGMRCQANDEENSERLSHFIQLLEKIKKAEKQVHSV